MAAARISKLGAPTNVAFPPSPIHLVTAFNNCHEAPEKTLPTQADLSWSPVPHVPLCTAAFPFFFSSYYILLPFCLVCLNRHLLLLGPETHSLSEHAYLCTHPVIAFSPFQLHLTMSTFVFFFSYSGRFLQHCFLLVCHMAILVNPARGILFAHCAFDVALSPPRFPAH